MPAAGEQPPDEPQPSRFPAAATSQPQQRGDVRRGAGLALPARLDGDSSQPRYLKLLLVASPHHRATPDLRGLVAFLENRGDADSSLTTFTMSRLPG